MNSLEFCSVKNIRLQRHQAIQINNKNDNNMSKLKSKKTVTAKPATIPARSAAARKTAAKTPTSSMTPPREITGERIASRAYSLWEQQGRPHGRDLELWLQAESQLKQASQSFAA